MVRNLYILKGLPSLPIRSQRYKTGPRRIELDQQADKGEEGEHEHQTDTGKDEIDTALHHKSCL